MEENTLDILTPGEKLRVFGDRLIGSIIQKSELCRKNRNHIFGMFDSTVFRDENYLIYHTVYKFRDTIPVLDEEFLSIFLTQNMKVLEEANGNYINLSAFSTGEDDERLSYIGAVLNQFKRLQKFNVLGEDEFKLTCEKYRMIWLGIEASKIYEEASQILVNGVKKGRNTLVGYDDSKAFINKEFSRLEGVSSRDAGEGFVSMRGFNEDDDKKKSEKIADWGIDELDKHFGGIYTNNFISILAPPKNGKTKLCANIAHKVAVENGNAVVVWAIEGGRRAFSSQLRAKHFDYMYNREITDISKKITGISAGVIKDNKYSNEKVKQLEIASREDLYNNPKYGEIMFIEKPCNAETFISEIDTAVQSTGAKLVVVDYLQLISSTTGKSERERVGDAYIAALKYCNEKNITFLSPAQYTQEVIKEIVKSNGNTELRTGGGKSGEVVKTPDINIALWATEEDLIRQQMSMLSIPSRSAEPFPKFDLRADLAVCNFCSLPEGI